MTKICPDCGTEQDELYKFCNNCGASLESKVVEEARKVEISEENLEEAEVESAEETIEAEVVTAEDTNEAEVANTEDTTEAEVVTAEDTNEAEVANTEDTTEAEVVTAEDTNEGETADIESEETDEADADEDIKRCVNCGTILHDEKFCPNCGKSTETLPQGKTCPNCGTEINEEKFCPKCGQKLDSEAQMNRKLAYCRNCGSQIDAESEICPKCGVRQKNPPVENKNPLFALILSFIFPGLGQIYNGQNHKGILLIISYIISGILILLLIGFILLPLIWIYGMYDAYKTAELINNGEYTEDKLFGI